jgi:hypothetical protein
MSEKRQSLPHVAHYPAQGGVTHALGLVFGSIPAVNKARAEGTSDAGNPVKKTAIVRLEYS